MQRKDGQGDARLAALRIAEQDPSNLRINRAGRPDDMGIHFARIENDRAVFHVKTAIERKTRLAGHSFFNSTGRASFLATEIASASFSARTDA